MFSIASPCCVDPLFIRWIGTSTASDGLDWLCYEPVLSFTPQRYVGGEIVIVLYIDEVRWGAQRTMPKNWGWWIDDGSSQLGELEEEWGWLQLPMIKDFFADISKDWLHSLDFQLFRKNERPFWTTCALSFGAQQSKLQSTLNEWEGIRVSGRKGHFPVVPAIKYQKSFGCAATIRGAPTPSW